jgi:hypothetical protein
MFDPTIASYPQICVGSLYGLPGSKEHPKLPSHLTHSSRNVAFEKWRHCEPCTRDSEPSSDVSLSVLLWLSKEPLAGK